MSKFKLFTFIILCLFALNCFSAVPVTVINTYSVQDYNKVLTNDIIGLDQQKNPLKKELQASALFLGKPYVLFPNGEGATAIYDKSPLYQTAAFDCLTYVSTVMALTLSHDLPQFILLMKKINYKNGDVSFITRNHFTSTDFNINNEKLGILKDITPLIKTRDEKSVAINIKTVINKSQWLKTISAERIKVFKYPGNQSAKKLLTQLQSLAPQMKIASANVAVIPLRGVLYNFGGEANLYLFNQIPAGAIVEIVELNPNKNATFNALAITHLGIAVPSSHGMLFREASSIHHKVTDVPLIGYLRGYLANRIQYAIHIEVINRNVG
tara:strand:- start:275 stop:1249 length:975 start_codon:yes stop_codon:yes gene_type:complete